MAFMDVFKYIHLINWTTAMLYNNISFYNCTVLLNM
jgi:hypothetical protein